MKGSGSLGRWRHYYIDIRPPKNEGEIFSVCYKKMIGDRHGGERGFSTREEAVAFLKGVIRQWEYWDPVLNREPPRVTPENLEFRCFTGAISKMELFGAANLILFMTGSRT